MGLVYFIERETAKSVNPLAKTAFEDTMKQTFKHDIHSGIVARREPFSQDYELDTNLPK
jgi:hypothetical protein